MPAFSFQSAPLTEARGDGDGHAIHVGLFLVSIRSPHRSKGRSRAAERLPVDQASFNPLPSPKQGEIMLTPQGHYQMHSFNPLPSPKQGEIRLRRLSVNPRQSSFNPLPSPKQGEISGVPLSAGSGCKFQSAPLTEARGDPLETFALVAFFKVSIRSPHRSKGRSMYPSGSMGVPVVSIRSPHRSKGRSQRQNVKPWIQSGFNPLPSPKQGEIFTATAERNKFYVSIRSPHRSKGRWLNGTVTLTFSFQFQSAPLTEARGDHPFSWQGRYR